MRYCITGTLSDRRNPHHPAAPFSRPFPRGQTPGWGMMLKVCGDSSVKGSRRKLLLDPISTSLYPKTPQMSKWPLLASQQSSPASCLELEAIRLVNLQLIAESETPQILECMKPYESHKRDHLRSTSGLTPRRKPQGKLPWLTKYKLVLKTS